MATIGSLAVNIVARTANFVKSVTLSRSVVRGFSNAVKMASGVVAGFGIALAATAAVGFKRMLDSANQFQQAMANSTAIMGKLSDTLRAKMTNTAIEVAKTTKFSAKEAAEAYFFLASAGLDANQSMGALPVTAKFAQAGNFDLALATDLLTDAQSALGLTVKDTAQNIVNMTRVSDALVKANVLANATAQQFSEALTNKAGAALRLVNKDIEEGLAVLAAWADQGIKGAEAGTALGIVMRDLQTKAIQNGEKFRAAGVAVFNSAGNMRNLADIVGDLERALDGMSDSTSKATLLNLGFADKSVAFIQTLLGMSDKIRTYEKGLRSAAGITDEVANKQLTAFAKAINKLSAAWEEFSIKVGGPMLEDIARIVSRVLVPGFTDMAKQTQAMTGHTKQLGEQWTSVGDAMLKLLDLTEYFIRGWTRLRIFIADTKIVLAEIGRVIAQTILYPLSLIDTDVARAMDTIQKNTDKFIRDTGRAQMARELQQRIDAGLPSERAKIPALVGAVEIQEQVDGVAQIAAAAEAAQNQTTNFAERISGAFIGATRSADGLFDTIVQRATDAGTALTKFAGDTRKSFWLEFGKGLFGLNPQQPQLAPDGLAGRAAALERGTTAAYSAALRGGQGDPVRQIAENSKKQLAQQEKQTRALLALERKAGAGGQVVSIPNG